MHWGGVSSTVTDFDEDDDPDLLVHNSMGLFLYRNLGRPVDQRVYDNRRARLGEPEPILFGSRYTRRTNSASSDGHANFVPSR